MSKKMHDIRRDHSINSIIIQNNDNPILEVKSWLEEALSKDIQDANAMVLCTVDISNCPSSRIVLARDINSKGVIFYTNYLSDKSKDIDNNPNVLPIPPIKPVNKAPSVPNLTLLINLFAGSKSPSSSL